MTLETPLVVQNQMLVRKPIGEVFNAFVNPEMTTRFWFTKSSGRLEAGATIQWEWEMYGASTKVMVTDLVPNKRIRIEWDDPPCPVEWVFEERGESTLVRITTEGFSGSDDEVVAKAIDSKGGFALVLAGVKAYMEHGIALNLVADQYPDAHRGGA